MDFIRAPRLPAPSVPNGDIVVDAPPDLPKTVPANPLARLLPVAVIVATVGMMTLYFTSGAAATRNPMFMFFPVMMLASIAGSLAYGTRGTTRTAEVNRDRRDYLRYLATLDAAIADAAVAQHRSQHWLHPDPADLWTLVGRRRMWERAAGDSDYCVVRVGLGDQPLSATLTVPETGSADELDPVTSTALHRLVRHRSFVPDAPITLRLPELSVITIDGDVAAARAMLRSLICQLAVLHSPEQVKVVAVLGLGAESAWEWLKWLPHHEHPLAFDAVGPARMTYSSLLEAPLSSIGDAPPHVVVIVDGGVTTGIDPVPTDGVTIIEIGTSCAAAAAQLEISGASLTIHHAAGDEVHARPDAVAVGQALVCARRLAPYRPAGVTAEGGHGRRASISWPEMMGLRDLHDFDPEQRWSAMSGGRMLKVPIGVSEDGERVELDIKEAAQGGMGPHGLCVGATGSGKSEFLRTLTLGMIAAHSPDDLNLVLVDFKGGATFLGMDRANHVSAVITNLADEAHLVNRMHDALTGEMNRRQELLRAAGNCASIADYRRARGGGLPSLPVLFVVVDEFSELLSQHPDFAELFVAIGRLGRSLGMHLLLASQRLDEGRLRGLETHLSYRICLKTFSASESRAVLGVPDAYHLPSAPGAAYLKTASGGMTRFQTAFVSGPHVPSSRPSGQSGSPAAPQLFTVGPVGLVVENQRPAPDHAPASVGSVMDVMLDRLTGRGTTAHRVWLPPLTDSPTLDVLLAGYVGRAPLAAPIGLIDCPYEQRREVLLVELNGAAGNVAVVGGPRAGKSTALRTFVAAMAATHDPSATEFYCLDFGGGALASLRQLPHVGSVAGRLDDDLCRRTVAQIESVLRAREARAGGAVTEDPYGDVFLIIDGWSTFRQEFANLEASVIALAAQGLSFGVHVVVAASRWADMRPALKDQLGTRIELRLGDPAESEMDRKRARQLATCAPGHGITREGKEFVIAVPSVGRVRDGRCAPPVELLPTRVEHAAIADAGPLVATQVAVGLGEHELRPVRLDFGKQPHLLILGEGECGKTSTLRLLCREIVRTNTADAAQVEIVDVRRSLLGVVESDHLSGYASSTVALNSRLPALLDRLQARMPGEDVTQQQLRARSWWSGPEIYVVVDDYDLVAGTTGNPLTPLADFIPHAKDLGLHVIVARRSGGAARAMFDPVLARLRDVGCMGLMMSASPDEGILLGSVRPTPLPTGRGTLITRGSADQLIQVAWTDPP